MGAGATKKSKDFWKQSTYLGVPSLLSELQFLFTDENKPTPPTTTEKNGKNTHGCPSETRTTLGATENTPSFTLHLLMVSLAKVTKLHHTAATKFYFNSSC